MDGKMKNLEQRKTDLDSETVIQGMKEAWMDHRHCRDQTWRTVAATVSLAVGLVTLQQMPKSDPWTTMLAGIFVLVAAFSGMLIVKYHRVYEIRKFTHIMQCEHWLKLRKLSGNEFVSQGGVLHWDKKPETLPSDIMWIHVLLPWKQNTPLFLIRIHAFIFVFTLFYLDRDVILNQHWIVVAAGLSALIYFCISDFLSIKRRIKY